MATHKSTFVVLEGLDGAGTTTQAQRLVDHWPGSGRVLATREPTDGPIGRLIRAVLSGSFEAPGDTVVPPGEESLSLLFAADRDGHSRWIEARRLEGSSIVSDRFVWSSIAYQSLDPLISAERVVELNRSCARPDLTIFIRTPVETCLERLAERAEPRTIYEKRELLEGIARSYDASRELYEKHYGAVAEVDGSRSIDEVHADIVALADRLVHA